MIIEQEIDSLKSAYELQGRSELRNIRLKRADVSRQVDGDEDLPREIQLRLSHRAVTSAAPEKTLRALVEFILNGVDAANPDRIVFQVNCTFQADYGIQEGYVPSDEAVESFTRCNAVYNCWPFAREFVQSVATRLGLTLPPLPLFRVQPKTRTEAKAQQTQSKVEDHAASLNAGVEGAERTDAALRDSSAR